MAKNESSQARLSGMRREIEALTRDRVSPGVARFASRTEATVGSTAAAVQTRTRAFTGFVRQQPFTAIAGLSAAGWLFGRVLHHRSARRHPGRSVATAR